jgi:hypothetical protein
VVQDAKEKAPATGKTRRLGACFDIFEQDLSPLERFFSPLIKA